MLTPLVGKTKDKARPLSQPIMRQWLVMPRTIWHYTPHEGIENPQPQRMMFGGLIEMVIWQLPKPTAERPHGLKYRLVYAVDGERVVGYDNETGKGDHKHLGTLELPYRFVNAETFVADFYADVRRYK